MSPAPPAPVVYTGDIFRAQAQGGISRVFIEVARRLPRPVSVVAGLHRSRDLAALGARVSRAARRPVFRGHRVLLAPLDWLVDAACLPRRAAILHPTYYRPPASLPAGVPWVVTVHDMAHERLPALFRRSRWSPDPARHKLAMCARAARIVCYSESTRCDLIAALPACAPRVTAIPLAGRVWEGVSAESIPGVPEPFVLWVGERHRYKNWAPTMEAFARASLGRGVGVLCAGGGPFRPAEWQHLARLGLDRCAVHRTLTEPQLRWAYERAAALLYTSLWEGFGLPVLEALALGCPVLCSDRASLPEVGGGAAIYADPEDPEALREGILRVLAEERTTERVAARRAQAARFDWDATARGYERVYHELDP